MYAPSCGASIAAQRQEAEHGHTIDFDSEAIDLLIRASADEQSVAKGIGHVAAAGMLGTLAKDFGRLAEQVERSGYVPPARREEYERHDRLAKSVGDREVAAYHRERARAIKAQLGEGK